MLLAANIFLSTVHTGSRVQLTQHKPTHACVLYDDRVFIRTHVAFGFIAGRMTGCPERDGTCRARCSRNFFSLGPSPTLSSFRPLGLLVSPRFGGRGFMRIDSFLFFSRWIFWLCKQWSFIEYHFARRTLYLILILAYVMFDCSSYNPSSIGPQYDPPQRLGNLSRVFNFSSFNSSTFYV